VIKLLISAAAASEELTILSNSINPASVPNVSSEEGLAIIASFPHPFLTPETIVCSARVPSSSQSFYKALHALS
jgi:hypothetical protein